MFTQDIRGVIDVSFKNQPVASTLSISRRFALGIIAPKCSGIVIAKFLNEALCFDDSRLPTRRPRLSRD